MRNDALPDKRPGPRFSGLLSGRARGARTSFAERYGPWALVAGGTDGIGAAFARELAARGLSLMPVARRSELLQSFARELAERYPIRLLPLSLDLATPEGLSTHERLIDLNCRAPALAAHYAASKAYVRVLAEGLWEELRPSGVDVLACNAGLVRTPTLLRENPRHGGWLAAPLMGKRQNRRVLFVDRSLATLSPAGGQRRGRE